MQKSMALRGPLVRTTLAAVLAVWMLAADSPPADPGQRADQAFSKKRYEEALKEYETVLKARPGEARAIYRAATCQALLFRYAEAAERIARAPLPAEPRWRARFWLLKAELGREFLKTYGHGISREVEEGSDDVTRKTPDEWKAEIEASFAELWKLREQLVSWPITDEKDTIDLGASDVELAPTFLDFVVLRWTGYLTSGERTRNAQGGEAPISGRPEAEKLVAELWSPPWSAEAPSGAQAASILETAARMPAKGRELAAELWKLRRMELPFTEAELVRLPVEVSALKAFRGRAIQAFERLIEEFDRPRAKGRAGLRAARLLDEEQEYERAVRLCQRVEKLAGGTSGAEECAELKASIELPRVELEGYPVPVSGKRAFRFQARNVDELFFRAWKTTPQELEKLQAEARARYGGQAARDFQHLRRIEPTSLGSFVSRSAFRQWSVPSRAGKPYHYVKAFADFPEAEKGLYVVAASNDRKFPVGGAIVKGVVATVTGVFLVGSSGQKGLPSEHEGRSEAAKGLRFWLYALDAETGAPVEGASLEGRWTDYTNSKTFDSRSDADGRADLATPVSAHYNSHQLDALAARGQDLAYLAHPLQGYYQQPHRFELRLETDRPIYRPGQKLTIKVTGLERVPRGLRAYRGSRTVLLQVMDPNYQEIFRKDLKLGEMGSASAEVTIPAGRLLGAYSASATLNEPGEIGTMASARVQVEEYKRPEFEVAIDAPKGAWKLGQKAQVSGAAKFYFGGPVPEAPVSYRVFRQVYVPWFCWWWRGFSFDTSRREVASGSLKTDTEGAFRFEFTPEPPEQESARDLPVTFTVETDARDPGGRTISTSRDFRAGRQGLLFNIPLGAGFFR
ncbi:MAG TPA: MG2 domain-containing protein, partial [Bdellovibrionota bacterium]|nr:MG2 domain-containing protein [Bdellovibrionota bacterium]